MKFGGHLWLSFDIRDNNSPPSEDAEVRHR